MRIAYQDEGSGWGEAAARRVDEHAALLACRTVEEVFVAVEAGLATHGVLPIETSTTGSVRKNYDALVAHALSIVAEVELGVGEGERTRFLAVGEPLAHAVADKTTIVFSLPDEPGALWRAISVFALRMIDLTRLESRPIPGQPWAYLFYADLAATTDDVRCVRALEQLAEFVPTLRTLGSYPSWKPRALPMPDPFEMHA